MGAQNDRDLNPGSLEDEPSDLATELSQLSLIHVPSHNIVMTLACPRASTHYVICSFQGQGHTTRQPMRLRGSLPRLICCLVITVAAHSYQTDSSFTREAVALVPVKELAAEQWLELRWSHQDFTNRMAKYCVPSVIYKVSECPTITISGIKWDSNHSQQAPRYLVVRLNIKTTRTFIYILLDSLSSQSSILKYTK